LITFHKMKLLTLNITSRILLRSNNPGVICLSFFQNIQYIINNCNVDLKLNEYKFPLFALPSGETSFSYLQKISYHGLSKRYVPVSEKAVNRLEYELSVIEELNFTDYFLVVWDIATEAKKRG